MELEELSGKIRNMEEKIIVASQKYMNRLEVRAINGDISVEEIKAALDLHSRAIEIENDWHEIESSKQKQKEKAEYNPVFMTFDENEFHPANMIKKLLRHVLILEPQVCTFRAIQSPVIFSDEEVDYLEEVLSEVLKDLKDMPE